MRFAHRELLVRRRRRKNESSSIEESGKTLGEVWLWFVCLSTEGRKRNAETDMGRERRDDWTRMF